MTPFDVPTQAGAAPEPRSLTPHVAIQRISVLVNPLSGSVGPRAVGELDAILSEYPLDFEVVSLEDGAFDTQVQKAFANKPDVIFVLAGDGTAGTVASRAGPKGPLVAPLPGGTMNMLPKALYGTTDWKLALRQALEHGVPQPVAGGTVEGQAFFCAAILGSPALWAPAREAMRTGKLKKAWQYGRRALRRAFSGRLRYSLDGSDRRKTEALVLISPMISAAMDEPIGLEAAAMDPSDTSQAFRLAANALFSDWRHDPSVSTKSARRIEAWGRSKIPAVVDGEPMLLPHETVITFIPKAFMALAPRTETAGAVR
ncbi:diacylglycerol/lipid kinase family protein [Brevundimonas variabilis]|uniref:Diacylglycerol kinase family enzyme n=1 Tax=Brevundimonas variabilis TaxID=74312 RepID=A0A7W9CG39_9CAUL|nr:diacylglycerol kinase family protein [Brevundimonas variabilis]MBB5745027.1 diacylglycerol kinase family enzyme [Brevundimonas variabilis]